MTTYTPPRAGDYDWWRAVETAAGFFDDALFVMKEGIEQRDALLVAEALATWATYVCEFARPDGADLINRVARKREER
jgi:hypothetical protein